MVAILLNTTIGNLSKGIDAMSVILGYKTEDKIYLGADNRTVTLEEVLSRDDVKKIVAVNNNVAVAFAGYNKSQMLFEKMITNVTDKSNFYVEDALRYIKLIHWLFKLFWYRNIGKEGRTLSSRFIIAGKNRKGKPCLYITSILNGKLEKPSLTDRFIFPPSDADAKTCCDIYAINALNHRSNFIQRTIKDISKISKLISPTGDIWVYDIVTDKSILEHFS